MEREKLTKRLQSQPGTYKKREDPGGRLEKDLQHRKEGRMHPSAGLLVSRPGAGSSTLLGEFTM